MWVITCIDIWKSWAGVDLVALYEGAGYGLTWANVLEDEFSIATILVLLLADSLVYAALAW